MDLAIGGKLRILPEAVAHFGRRRRGTWYQNSRKTRLIESAIDELSGWHCFSDEFLEDQVLPRASCNILPGFFGDPFEREAPKVRLNDLCPCGSGKKFKKCRLQ
jgi:hypothetical protein